VISHFWDIVCTFIRMVAPFIARPSVATVRVTDHEIAGRPRPGDLARLSAPLTSVLTDEVDEVQRSIGVATEEILLAAFARTVARTIGTGVVTVDFTDGADTSAQLELQCSSAANSCADEMLAAVQRALGAASSSSTRAPAEVFISYLGSAPELACFDHALEIRIYRDSGVLNLDWRYDSRQFASYTVEELSEQFPLALIELTSEATQSPVDATIAVAAFGG
jgi:hypothetical protein